MFTISQIFYYLCTLIRTIFTIFVAECCFYITNFPENWKSKDLMEVFSRFGKVSDVIIPEKRNRVGWKYAFTRFRECDDVVTLEKNLDNIWIGSFKLRANIAKFKDRIITMIEGLQRRKNRVTNQALIKENVSFAEVIRNHKKTSEPVGNAPSPVQKQSDIPLNAVTPQVSILDSSRKYTPGKKEFEWIEGALVGKAKCFEDWQVAETEIKNLGYNDVSISPLNGESWLIAGKNAATMTKFSIEEEEWIKEWLIDCHNWEFSDGITERKTWVQISGIPLNFWNESFIQWLVAEEGVIVEIDPCIKSRLRLDVARILLRTNNFSIINRNITGVYLERKFTVIIKEELTTFSPWLCPIPKQKCRFSIDPDSELSEDSSTAQEDEFVADSTPPSPESKTPATRKELIAITSDSHKSQNPGPTKSVPHTSQAEELNAEIILPIHSRHDSNVQLRQLNDTGYVGCFENQGDNSHTQSRFNALAQENMFEIGPQTTLETEGPTSRKSMAVGSCESPISESISPVKILKRGEVLGPFKTQIQNNPATPVRSHGPDRISSPKTEPGQTIRYSPIGITLTSTPIGMIDKVEGNVQSGNKEPKSAPPIYPTVKMIFKNLQCDLSSQKVNAENPATMRDPVSDSEDSMESSMHIPVLKETKFKRARRKRLRKMQKKKLLKKREIDWALFTNGLRDSVEKGGRSRTRSDRGKLNKNGLIQDTEAEMAMLFNEGAEIKAMEPSEVCELGKRLGVINEENEELILKKISEMEGRGEEGKKVYQTIVDQ